MATLLSLLMTRFRGTQFVIDHGLACVLPSGRRSSTPQYLSCELLCAQQGAGLLRHAFEHSHALDVRARKETPHACLLALEQSKQPSTLSLTPSCLATFGPQHSFVRPESASFPRSSPSWAVLI